MLYSSSAYKYSSILAYRHAHCHLGLTTSEAAICSIAVFRRHRLSGGADTILPESMSHIPNLCVFVILLFRTRKCIRYPTDIGCVGHDASYTNLQNEAILANSGAFRTDDGSFGCFYTLHSRRIVCCIQLNWQNCSATGNKCKWSPSTLQQYISKVCSIRTRTHTDKCGGTLVLTKITCQFYCVILLRSARYHVVPHSHININCEY